MFFGKWRIEQEKEIGKLKEFHGKNYWRLERISEQLKHLEKNYSSLKNQIREAHTARKELVTRIMKLEIRKKKERRIN